jgi:hypothetical protein
MDEGRDLGSWKWNLSRAVFLSTRHLFHLWCESQLLGDTAEPR